MPRTVRDAKLDSRAARAKLPARAKPYYKMLIPGVLHLGYRKRRKGLPGRWLVRRYIGLDTNDVGRYRSKDIALADDFLDADGEAIFSYAQAQQRAHEWRAGGETTAQPANGPLTVGVAVAKYITSLADNGRPTRDTQARAAMHITPTLGSVLVEELTTERLRRWLADMAKLPAQVRRKRGAGPRYKHQRDNEKTQRQRKATANRILTMLKAALNHCFDEGLAKSNDAWGRRLKPFRQVDGVRSRFLDVAEAKRLINAADPDFRKLVRAALYTGARYGELARMVVADFHSDSDTVAIGRSKSGKPRHVFLTAEGATFFRQLCAGRAGHQTMLPKGNGDLWKPTEQARPMVAAVTRAKITPPISFHGLRHTYASLAVMGGVPLHVLAKNLGHVDTRMVERVYGHLEDSYVREAIRAGAPRFGKVSAGNVVPLGKPGSNVMLTLEARVKAVVKIIGPTANEAAVRRAVPNLETGRSLYKPGQKKKSAKQLSRAVRRCIDLSRKARADRYIPKRISISENLVSFNYEQLMQDLETWFVIAKGWETAKLDKPKPSAEDKELAAQTALELCQQHNIERTTYKRGKYCRIAAALYGDPDANLQHQCRAVLELLRMEARINEANEREAAAWQKAGRSD